MKQFFTDRQVRKFTLKEKFGYIFKQLNTLLQPITEKTSHSYDYNKHTRYLKCLTYNENGVPSINNIELPFIDMKIKVENRLIKITGEKFCYSFPPEMMPEIWRRLKRML